MEIDDIQNIAVMGAGNMGHGIAEVAALSGYDVRMRDIKEDFVENGYEQIEWSVNKLAEKDQITDGAAESALDRVTPLVDLEESVAEADVVIEAVPEKMDIKKEVYRDIDEFAPTEAIFATNTSSLSITELSEVTDREGQFCGMHFFNPPVRMDLVEVIRGAHTDDETIDTIEALAEEFGKTPVRVRKDSPGFIFNRVLVPLLNEAAWLVHEDVADMETIDSTTKFDLGLPMGAFELTDMVGIDVSLDVLQYIESVLGEAYEPCPLLVEKVEAEDLGQKTGKGFYDYEDGGAEIPSDAGDEEIGDRLLALTANEVAKLVGEDVADPPQIDEAIQLGGGWPEGPAKMADEAGITHLHDILADRYEETGAERYEPAETLVEMAAAGESFYGEGEGAETGPSFEDIAVEVEGRVGHIELDREHRMNSLTPELVDEFGEAVDMLEADEAVRALLITGAGDRAFSAGADAQSFLGSANPIDAVELSRKGQQTFGKLEETGIPVLAAIDGYCLGGGMELATAADLRIATERSELGQPEFNLGLLPGWGGTQRLRHIVGDGRAKEIIFTAERYDAETMAEFGFINEVVDREEFEDRAWEFAEELASGPPIAQRFTKRAMLAGRESTEAGLRTEAQAFGQLIGTDDFNEGVMAFIEDRDPEFEGE